MPAKDIYHDVVKNALIKDGWTVTNDPFRLKWGARELFVDLGLSKLIAAQKAEQKIAVEIKSFTNPSSIADLEQALGQYLLYRAVLEEVQPDFLLYLAVRKITYQAIFSEPIGELVINKYKVNLLVFESKKQEVWQWIP
ncbi:XisH family protein [Okeania sp. SIO1F9]|uniref:XisH family protein n=1 Tax=Okeania sp. SIO1F9 TaxID=2607813 RepID=UPI00144EA388|nr:XisH family protein [Okeania sp. SIO1F9]NET79694.1 fatty-acid synthase [Okeania sp. SIO1F9]